MKNLLYVMGCLLLLSGSPVLAQTKPDVITMRVHERTSSISISIARGATTAETFEFKDTGEKNAGTAAVEYQKMVAKLYQEGYVMQGIIPGIQRDYTTITTLLFVKAPKP